MTRITTLIWIDIFYALRLCGWVSIVISYENAFICLNLQTYTQHKRKIGKNSRVVRNRQLFLHIIRRKYLSRQSNLNSVNQDDRTKNGRTSRSNKKWSIGLRVDQIFEKLLKNILRWREKFLENIIHW